MKHILLFLSFAGWVQQSCAQAVVTVAYGTSFKAKSNAFVVLKEMNLVNNGTISQTLNSATLKIAGTSDAGFSGSGTTTLDNLEIAVNNGNTYSLSAPVSLKNTLTISSGQLAAGGYLTLKSDTFSTARVAQITSAAPSPISGNVTVECYVKGRRKYRLITSSVTTHANAVLTSGQEAYSIWGAWQNGGVTSTPNVGSLITGGTVGDGYDQGTSNASLFTYDDVNRYYNPFSSANGKNTKYTPLKAGMAYLMFVYGDRLNSVFATTPHNTTLVQSGTLLTGDQAYTTSSSIPLSGVTGRFTLLGNPFASPINWATIPKTNLANTYWGWDPNLSSTGGYITVTTTGTVTLQAPYSGSTGLNQYIQPGQGFFVQTAGASPAMTIREQDKNATFNGNAFRASGLTSTPPLLAINLRYVNNGLQVLADGVLVAFDTSFSKAVGAEDAAKMTNGSAEAIALQNDTTALSIDARPLPVNNDTFFLTVNNLVKPQYNLQIFAGQLASSGLQAFLKDNYLHTLQALSLRDTNNIVFDVTAGIPASAASNRFAVVFQSLLAPLPVTYLSVDAIRKEKAIQVSWEVASQSSITAYEIEKSVDGIRYRKIGVQPAMGTASRAAYNWLDQTTGAGNNYYRVRAVQADGKFMMSAVVVIKMEAEHGGVSLFPNPVRDRQVTLGAQCLEKGRYTLQLFNPTGEQILRSIVNHSGGRMNQRINLPNLLPAGMYFLRLTRSNTIYDLRLFLE